MPNPTKKGKAKVKLFDVKIQLERKNGKLVGKRIGKMRNFYYKYRSAKTGRFVTKEYALKHLKTTVSEKVYI